MHMCQPFSDREATHSPHHPAILCRLVDGDETVQDVGQRIFDALLAVAAGHPTKSEAQGLGDEEFAPWQLGPTF